VNFDGFDIARYGTHTNIHVTNKGPGSDMTSQARVEMRTLLA
jgi:hypothetical protein